MKLFKETYRIESTRLREWDYTNPGWYFATICARDHRPFFGDVVEGEMQLSPIGEVARRFWLEIPDHFPHVDLDEFVFMPNHVHGILVMEGHNPICRDVACNVSTIINETMSRISPRPGSLATIIRSYKSTVTRWFRRHYDIAFAWQPRFHDHIVRTEKSLRAVRQYICNNPLKWSLDDYHPDRRGV